MEGLKQISSLKVNDLMCLHRANNRKVDIKDGILYVNGKPDTRIIYDQADNFNIRQNCSTRAKDLAPHAFLELVKKHKDSGENVIITGDSFFGSKLFVNDNHVATLTRPVIWDDKKTPPRIVCYDRSPKDFKKECQIFEELYPGELSVKDGVLSVMGYQVAKENYSMKNVITKFPWKNVNILEYILGALFVFVFTTFAVLLLFFLFSIVIGDLMKWIMDFYIVWYIITFLIYNYVYWLYIHGDKRYKRWTNSMQYITQLLITFSNRKESTTSRTYFFWWDS